MKDKMNNIRLIADSIGRDMRIDSFESFLLQINSSGELSVKGAKHISLCTQNEVGIDCAAMSVDIKGDGLAVRLYSEEETVVSGRIGSISFLWGGSKSADK